MLIDGINLGVTVNLGDLQPHYLTLDVPVEAYRDDGSIVVTVQRLGSNGAFVNEISLEQKTSLTTPGIQDIRVTNVSESAATISWITDKAATGMVHFGASGSLGQLAHDDRGASTSAQNHHVTLTGLASSTTYYFYVASADAFDDNGGTLYQFATGPNLPPPASDLIYGQVFAPDGVTAAEGAMVSVTLRDSDGQGSSGAAAPLSYIIQAADFRLLERQSGQRPHGGPAAGLPIQQFWRSGTLAGCRRRVSGRAGGRHCQRHPGAQHDPELQRRLRP